MLPDSLDLLDIDGRASVVRLMMIIAAADGELMREEIACIEAQMGRAMLSPEMRQDLRQLITDPPLLSEELEGQEQNVLRIGLRDGMLLASSDGVYHPAEVEILATIAEAAGVGAAELDQLYEWVDQGWRWMARGRAHISSAMQGDAELIRSAEGDR